jgi:peptidylprolyl isomerase
MKSTLIAVIILTFVTMNSFAQNNFTTTPSGLKYVIHKKGSGIKPKAGDKVKVHYEGKLTNNTVFDSSFKRGTPFEFELGAGQVIKGWDEGIALLNEGDSATLEIPSELGYGERDMGSIPANSTLIFDVVLVKVSPAVTIVPYNIEGKEILSTPSGLKYVVIESGKPNALKASENRNVKVHYTGYFADGKIFDSSVKRGEPISFIIGKGQVIKGWDEGIALMKVGDKMRMMIPYELAYGEAGRPPHIPAKADLTFDVELIDALAVPEIKTFDTKGKDTVATASGLKYIVVEEVKKKGVFPQPGQKVFVHYTGYFEDGKVFDSSVERGSPLSFDLGKGMVIKGWDEGIALMKKGEKFRLLIPYTLGYGDKGYPGAIPPKANLIFDVELIDIQ